jgi:hypothetical protein
MSENKENEPTIWMPVREHEEYKKWRESQTEEQKQRITYYFWNNFSHEGYEKWKENRKS